MPEVPETKSTWTDEIDAMSTTNLHAYLRDPFRFLMRKPTAELRRTTAQSIPFNTWTSMLWTVEDIDDDPDGVGGHSTSSNTSRYTARYPGWYLCVGGVMFDPDTTTRRGIRWSKNGSPVDASENFSPPTSVFEMGIIARPRLIFLAIGDYVELQAWQNRTAGTALNVTAANGEVQPNMGVSWQRLVVS